VAVDALDEDGSAASAYVSPYMGGEFGAGSLGYSSQELGVSVAEVWVGGVGFFCLGVEGFYALFCYVFCVGVGHVFIWLGVLEGL
jgi:hypothetical protein